MIVNYKSLRVGDIFRWKRKTDRYFRDRTFIVIEKQINNMYIQEEHQINYYHGKFTTNSDDMNNYLFYVKNRTAEVDDTGMDFL